MPKEVPNGWGKDKLSGFAESAMQNEMATFAHPSTAGCRMFEFALPTLAEELGVGAQNRSIASMLTLMINNNAGLIAEVQQRLSAE